MKVGRFAWVLLIVIAPSVPRMSGACSITNRFQYWMEMPAAGDTSPPMQLAVTAHVEREHDVFGCNCGGCPPISYLVFEPSAVDDVTPAEQIGYRFTVVRGTLPWVDLSPTYRRTGVSYDDVIGLMIPNDGELSIDVEVRAVDQAGNESAPIVVTIDG